MESLGWWLDVQGSVSILPKKSFFLSKQTNEKTVTQKS